MVVKRAKAEKELIRRNLSVSRVSKVVKGGKRFNFSALVVVGDGKGFIGYGAGKAREVTDAIKKASDIAGRRMEKIPLKEGRTIHQDVTGSFGAGKVHLRTAPKGTGVIAGGAMRAIFEVLGIQDVVAKTLNSSNPHNVLKATLAALKSIETPRIVAMKRGKKVSELFDAKSIKIHEGQRQENDSHSAN
jgi:small subunit ribosomal protein S5